MIYDNTFLELGQNMQTEVKSTIEVIDTNDSTISNNLNKNLLLTKSTEDKMILTHEFEKKKIRTTFMTVVFVDFLRLLHLKDL